jgi:N-acetylmuramoyl-L-alanine amidase
MYKYLGSCGKGLRACLSLAIGCLSLMAGTALGGIELRNTRLWPAEAYTRLTLESDDPLRAQATLLRDPLRLVVQLPGLVPNKTLTALASKVLPDDPYLAGIRIEKNAADGVRLVLSLKQEVRPQLFSLAPVGSYRQRLVLDLYPVIPLDPIMQLLKQQEARDSLAGFDALGDFARQLEKKARSGKVKNPSASKRWLTVAVDPGHGGEDPGAIGARGTREKDITLMIAKRLRKKIDAQPNMRAFLTRDADYFVPLHTRVHKARQVRSDVFISIHADAFISPTARGASVYALSEHGASSLAAKWIAQQENASDQIGGINLASKDHETKHVLFNLSTAAQIRDSLKLGHLLLQGIGNINHLHKPQVEQANFAVLKDPSMPSLLVEAAFISNPGEEAKLLDSGYQEQIVEAIVQGMRRYFAPVN